MVEVLLIGLWLAEYPSYCALLRLFAYPADGIDRLNACASLHCHRAHQFLLMSLMGLNACFLVHCDHVASHVLIALTGLMPMLCFMTMAYIRLG